MFRQPTTSSHVGTAEMRMHEINGHPCKLTKSEATISEIKRNIIGSLEVPSQQTTI